MLKIINLIILLSSLLTTANNLDINTIFKQGNNHFSNKEYSLALQAYKKIENNGLQSPELFFNIGNTYLKKQENALAILYFEKTLKLQSGVLNIEKALDRAREKANVDAEISYNDNNKHLFYHFFDFLTVNQWAFISVAFSMMSLWFYILYFKKNNRIRFFNFSILTIAIAVLTFLLSIEQYQYSQQNNYAIVLEKNIDLYKEKQENEAIQVLNSGCKIKILKQENEWVFIELNNNLKGWVKGRLGLI